METTTITEKKTVRVSFRNLRASLVTPSLFPSEPSPSRTDIFATIKGMSTVIEAREAMEIKIRSGTRKAA